MATTLTVPHTRWRHPLESGSPPAWASEWGVDRQHGPFCAFEIDEVIQRLRWIPPGTFWMGSSEEEEGRWNDEGPRHLVTIHAGFWIFDTPCTQRLWSAVMGENPSNLQEVDPSKTVDLPVERVSWDDCLEFASKLSARLEGLTLSLPSEAQWEYACRAGTETARYSEDLDAIAWYGENSEDKTHTVASKDANAWGLYDMLGNVWEWCADAWTDDYSKESRGASARRVIRGGSWRRAARIVRAACRDNRVPANRNDDVGCRLAEFREGS